MKSVSFLIKPASGRCNLRCKYCFYKDVADNRKCGDYGLLSEDILEKLVKSAFETAEERVSFAFQGGEPLLRGLAFYSRLIEFERQYARRGIHIEHSIQTNGTLIDEEWADFFRENRFLVGLSLDGIRELHDENRVDGWGKGSWRAAEKALCLMQKKQVDVNVLCVVTGQLARRGQAVYQNLKKLGAGYMQFIPCLDPLEKARGKEFYSLSPERYAHFLCTVFDQWYRDWESDNYISIRTFDDYVHLLAGAPAGSCATAGECGQYFVVEGDGSVFPCDFFVLDRWRMGSLQEMTLDELAKSKQSVTFNEEGRGAPDACGECRWMTICHGGCRRDWVGFDRNYYCQALKAFFEYAYPRLSQIAALERQMRHGG